jgi:sec-independent protein translocase protein TatC
VDDDRPPSLLEHLRRLRRHLVRAALGLLAAFVVCYAAVAVPRTLVLRPYAEGWTAVGLPGSPTLQALGALDAFLTDLRIAIIAAILVAGPFVFYQAMRFIAPALQRTRFIAAVVTASAVLFVSGAAFCYVLVLPVATEFFLAYSLDASQPGSVALVPAFTYTDYVTYATKLLLAFGLMFELPLGVFFLASIGLVTHRSLLRYWKLTVVVFFVVAAFLTPPDPITQILLAIPMIGLFFASVGVAYVVSRPPPEADDGR